MLSVAFVVGCCVGICFADNFPSLISTNATFAVVIDREYLANRFESTKDVIETFLIYAKREILKHGGVNVQYYTWSNINIKREITAILSIASCLDTWKLFRVASEGSIFHMAISESDCPRLPPTEAITIPLITRGEELPQILLDLRTSNIYKWHSIAILYDETVNRDQVTRLVKSLTADSDSLRGNGAGITLIKLDIDKNQAFVRRDIYDVLAGLAVERVGRNFLAIVGLDLVEVLMEYAKTLQLVTTKNQWCYVISNTHAQYNDVTRFQRYLREGDNVAFVYNNTVVGTNEICLGGLECHTKELLAAFTKALDEAILVEFETAALVSDEEWEAIRPTKQDRRNSLLQSVKKYLFANGECDNCTSWLIKTGDTWGREYLANNSRAELIPVGNWRPGDGLSVTDVLYPHVAHGFRGRNLPMVSFHNPPWQMFTVNETGSVTLYQGLIFDVIRELARNLNFTFTVETIDSQLPLSVNSNGSNVYGRDPSEMLHLVTNFIPEVLLDMVKNKSVAFGAGAFTVTESGKQVVNFTRPISVQAHTFLASRPKELSRALLFMSPFTGDTWLCLTAAIISMGPILYYINRFSPVYEYKGIRKRGGLSSIENCIWYMYGALLQQGGMHLPSADSARILVGAWWLVVLVVATTYCGNLVAFLTFPKIDIPLTNLDELLAHRGKVSWSMTKGSYLETLLQTTPGTKYKLLYERRRQEPMKPEELIERIEQGKHVFLEWKLKLQFMMKKQYLQNDRCDLVLGREEFFDEQLAMIVAQDSPYLEIINDEIKKLHQVGLIQKWLTDYMPKRDKCWRNQRHIVEVNNHTVNLDDMQGSFFVLFLGFLLSFLLTLCEKCWHRYTAKRHRNQTIAPFIS